MTTISNFDNSSLAAAWSRRRFLLSLAAAGVGGCSYSPNMQSTVETLSMAIQGHPDVPLTRRRIRDLPYASIGAKIGKGPRSLLVLGKIEGDDLHWISADRTALVTRRGRLTATAGLPEDLKATVMVGEDPVTSGLHLLQQQTTVTRMVDIMPGKFFHIPVLAKFERLREERIEILELEFDTVVVREQCSAPLLDWEFENLYWADQQSGFIWRSLQHTTPLTPQVKIEIFKPAA